MQKTYKPFIRDILFLPFAMLFFSSLLVSDLEAKDNVEKMGDAFLVLIPSSTYAATFFFKSCPNFYFKIHDQ